MNAPARPDPARRRALLAAVAAPRRPRRRSRAALSAAPVIATDAVCLRPSQEPGGTLVSPPLNISGSGFSPNGPVSISRGGRQETAFADATGAFAAQLSVLDLLRDRVPRSRPLDIVAADPGLGSSNPLRIRTAALAFSATPKRTRPSNTVTFTVLGIRARTGPSTPTTATAAACAPTSGWAGRATPAAC